MSGAFSSTVTPQHVGSERANWWDQSREAQGFESRSEEKGRESGALTVQESKDMALFSFCQHFFLLGGGVRKQWALLVHVIDTLESSRRSLQSFINEFELCLNPLQRSSLAMSLLVSPFASVACYWVCSLFFVIGFCLRLFPFNDGICLFCLLSASFFPVLVYVSEQASRGFRGFWLSLISTYKGVLRFL